MNGATSVSSQNIVTDIETLSTFKSHPSYIYRYPKQSGANSGISAFTMFAHRVDTTIPSWFQAEGDDASSSAVTNYTVRSCLLDEQWEVFRRCVFRRLFLTLYIFVPFLIYFLCINFRFNEFSQFHKTIQKEGIKPAEPVSLDIS